MEVKAFEIRDQGTFIPAIAIRMLPGLIVQIGQVPATFAEQTEAERYLLRRSGFSFEDPLVILCRMEAAGVDRNATYDPFSWGSMFRTMQVAHVHIQKHWEQLQSGAVIDVQFILGETKEPKTSEAIKEPL